MSSFTPKKVLIIGATSGIGLALADHFVSRGTFVIVTGRREQNLSAFVSKHGSSKSSSLQLDVTDLPSIPSKIADLLKAHPDIDSVIINAGIQRKSDFSDPESVDLEALDQEWKTNYTAPLHLTKFLLPHLQKLARTSGGQTSLVFTTSNLALVPMMRAANYSASKGALHNLILCLREQVKGSGVKVIEVLPPAVQTELHDQKNQPDLVGGHEIGMPLAEFVRETFEGLDAGKDQIREY